MPGTLHGALLGGRVRGEKGGEGLVLCRRSALSSFRCRDAEINQTRCAHPTEIAHLPGRWVRAQLSPFEGLGPGGLEAL